MNWVNALLLKKKKEMAMTLIVKPDTFFSYATDSNNQAQGRKIIIAIIISGLISAVFSGRLL